MTATTLEQQDQAFEQWYASIDDCQSDEPERVYELSEEGMEQLTKECMLQGWKGAIAALPLPVMPQQAEPVTVEAIRDAVYENAYDLYCCQRVWSAWGVGTMTEDDFISVRESEEIISNIVNGVLAAIPKESALLARVAELEARDAKREAEIKRERLMNVAVKKAADMGIPIEDIHRFIDEDEDRTGTAVEAFAKRWKAFSEKAVETALKEKLGNNGQPRGGNTPAPADLKTQYEAASKVGNGVEMLRLKGLMQAANVQE